MFKALIEEIEKHVVGYEVLIEKLIVGLLCDGHILLEGAPGLAKTKTLSVLSQAIGAKMQRVQFTPDLLPSDIVGTEIYRPQTGEFIKRKGPVFTNFFLADEINRAPAKVQSALLQSMQEKEVTIGDETFNLPKPFLVLATQNPLEQEGTYPLPEAQLDRFLMKIIVDYPSFETELKILDVISKEDNEVMKVKEVLSLDNIYDAKRKLQEIYCDEKLDKYIVSIVQATRTNGLIDGNLIEYGASPRASIALKKASVALAYLRGKHYVSPEEVQYLAYDVLRHRIIASFEADSKGISNDEIIKQILNKISVP
jgi:MoxR-like ATPase